MASGELLLELLSEEIPAGMQRRAIDDLKTRLSEWLLAHRISPSAGIRGYVTPRRLTIVVRGIPKDVAADREERRGPRVGAPQPALDGFLRSVGLQSIDECEIRDTGRGEFYFAVIERPGRPIDAILPDLIRSTLFDFPWPKSMRFPSSTLRWVRPLTSVVCLFDGQVVAVPLDGIPVGNSTRGHRFLAPAEIAVDGAEDYFEKLASAYVILDHDRRRALIEDDLNSLAAAENLSVKPDPGLLDEVAGLVEFPVVLIGAIDDASMALPPEVLATAMRTHQKYFSCLKPDGSPAPRFLFVANNLTPDDGKTITAGNERVLKARLADARFFSEQDQKVPLASRVDALKDRIYYEKLGTMFDKAERIERLAGYLAEQLNTAADGALVAMARRAARLAKADLSTGMVGEFPELQGIMGRYYARNEPDAVADAIADHYKPQGPNDSCPTLRVSIAVALADKLDALAAFFSIGEKPTGSRDPFALRRAALGIIRLILENELRLSLRPAFAAALKALQPADGDGVQTELLDFIADRLKVHLREQGVRHDLIAAVFALGEDDLLRLLGRVRALSAFLDTESGLNLLTAYRRAGNIVAIEERRDGHRYDDEPPEGLREPAETTLYAQLMGLDGNLQPLLEGGHFEQAMTELSSLRRWVDEFFDKVTVNTDDRALRKNRLRLLSRIRAVMNQVADFSQIEG